MSLGKGSQAFIGWAQEVTYGTPVHPPTKFIEFETESFKGERRYNVRGLLGHTSQRRTVKGKMNVSGGFKTDFVWEGMEQLLKHGLGSVVTTGPAGGLYTHTFSPAASLPAGLSMYVNRDGNAIGGSSAFQYSGCKIAKLTLSQEMEMPLTIEAEVIGRDRQNVAVVAQTYPTYDCPQYFDMTVKAINPASANFDLPIKSLTIVIDNGLYEDQFRLGEYRRAGLDRGSQRKVTLEAECEFESLTAYAYFRDLVTSDLQFKWVSGSKVLTITFPKVTFDGEDPNTGDAGPYYMKLSCTALANAADGDELGLVLVNTTSSVG